MRAANGRLKGAWQSCWAGALGQDSREARASSWGPHSALRPRTVTRTALGALTWAGAACQLLSRFLTCKPRPWCGCDLPTSSSASKWGPVLSSPHCKHPSQGLHSFLQDTDVWGLWVPGVHLPVTLYCTWAERVPSKYCCKNEIPKSCAWFSDFLLPVGLGSREQQSWV